MGFQSEYEYQQLPTTADGQVPDPVRKRCRKGKLLAHIIGISLVIYGVHHYYGGSHATSFFPSSRTPCHGRLTPDRSSSMETPVQVKEVMSLLEDREYDKGEIVQCYGDDDDVKIPAITLDSDNVYFFDFPPKHPGRGDASRFFKGTSHPGHRHPGHPRWITSGSFKLEASDKVKKVTVHATIDPGELQFAKVCEFVRESGARGVGVVVPEDLPSTDFENRIEFTVKVPPGAKLAISHLETVFVNYTQDIGDIGKTVALGGLNLINIQGHINTESISVNGPANVSSINGNITGSYSAIDSFHIAAVTGYIDVDVALLSSSSASANLSISGVTYGVDAAISLGTKGDEHDAVFKVDASSIAGPLNITFADAPVGSKLTLSASTVKGAADISLHPTFEGTFEATTISFGEGVVLRTHDGEKDPTGESRKRTVESHPIGVPLGRGLAGSVFWGDELPEDAGKIKLSTFLGPSAITF